MSGYLFINYRKNDTVVVADSLNAMLRNTFGNDAIFLDSSEIESGASFPEKIQQALDKTTCMLVLIGPQWLFQQDSRTGEQRLRMKDDWVRREIEHALNSNISVIPVLAPGASLPEADAMPASILALLHRVTISLRSQSYVEDRHTLLERLANDHDFKKIRIDTSAHTPRNWSRSALKSYESSSPTLATEQATGTKSWVNGTTLHYCFLEINSVDAEQVRHAFEIWKDVGIGLDFVETTIAGEAEIRITFDQNNGSWSYVGIDAINVPVESPTMNFGWALTEERGLDTALHEIGHLLGFANEHQNPHAGIEWDEAATYAMMSDPPNYWSRDTTFQNIIRKGNPDHFYGPWDPDSIMHHPFAPGLINEPEIYKAGLKPAPGLSLGDREKIRFLYPPLTATQSILNTFEPVLLNLQPGEQLNLSIIPDKSRIYSFQTFGAASVVMMLFEQSDTGLQNLAADDNTGESRDAAFTSKLVANMRYVLRVRLFERTSNAAAMMW